MECESCVFLGLFFFCFNFKYNKYQVKPHKQKLFKTLNNFLEYKVIPELKCLKTAEIVYICIPNLCKAQARDLVSPGRLPSFYLGREKLSFPMVDFFPSQSFMHLKCSFSGTAVFTQ